MNDLILLIENLKKSSIRDVIETRKKEFEAFREKSSNEIFKELCFCLLTANFSAAGGLRIQNEINDGFLFMDEENLNKKLSELRHRFPNARTRFIIGARKYKDNLKEILSSFSNEKTAREWLVKNIKGLGFKESSHFLRNIGYNDVAIIDFHILDLLSKQKIIELPKNRTLTPKKYLEIESLLSQIAKKTNLSLGELDLYLWYEETGKVLK